MTCSKSRRLPRASDPFGSLANAPQLLSIRPLDLHPPRTTVLPGPHPPETLGEGLALDVRGKSLTPGVRLPFAPAPGVRPRFAPAPGVRPDSAAGEQSALPTTSTLSAPQSRYIRLDCSPLKTRP